MPFDSHHDLTVQLYSSKLPYKVHASLVGFYQSGVPYTGTYEKGDGEPVEDVLNKNSKRAPAFKQIDISFSKYFTKFLPINPDPPVIRIDFINNLIIVFSVL